MRKIKLLKTLKNKTLKAIVCFTFYKQSRRIKYNKNKKCLKLYIEYN